MTFRARVTLLAAFAVGMAATGAAASLYVVAETQLVDQVDATLLEAASAARRPGLRPGGPFPAGSRVPLAGRPDVFAQIIDVSGAVVQADGQSGIAALVTRDARAVAAGTRNAYFFDTSVSDSHLRVYVSPFRPGQALEVARQLDEIDRALGETRLRLGVVALGSVALAAALGALVARGALGPVRHLTELVEEVARTGDLSRRLGSNRSDELGRLASSFDSMLGALDASLRSQRQLVADASHELRTPLTSLRTNLELLARGQPADPRERDELLGDLVGQMERLGTLVADLLDLARDEETTAPAEDLRLDELVAQAAEPVQAHYPGVRFVLETRPTRVRGVRPRLARAVTNLLDNAGKWSPPGGMVEVSVAQGEVSVRDHGPGVADEEAERVFDRFWRAANARALPGSGLGLAIVKDVAHSHGGSVSVERAAGGGARFRLKLTPLA